MKASELLRKIEFAILHYGDQPIHYGDDSCLSVTVVNEGNGEISFELS